MCRFFEFRQEQQAEEKGGDDVGGDGEFIVFRGFVGLGDDAGVFDDGIDAGESGVASLCKLLDALVRGEVELPDLDAVMVAICGALDGGFSSGAFGQVAHGEDDGLRFQAGEVASCFEALRGVLVDGESRLSNKMPT